MEAPLLRWVVLRGPAKLERNALNLRAEGLNLSSWAFFPPNLILNPGKHAKDKTLNLGAYLSLMQLNFAFKPSVRNFLRPSSRSSLTVN